MNIKDKKIAMFDLDGTLTASKSPLEQEMASLLTGLMKKIKVAVISGGGYPQFQSQFLAKFSNINEFGSNLLLLPTSGTKLYTWKGDWHEEYSEVLSKEEKEKIISSLNQVLKQTNYQNPEKVYGPIIEDRGSQITFSALGQNAPVQIKLSWDPDRKKREQIAELIKQKIPEFDVRVGGSTSVDITRKGVNKGYGIRRLEDYLKINADDMVFVGDALFYGGNDYPAKATGVDCVSVKGPEETSELIKKWLVDLE
jgi:HAD superfamily hydrolase (TIGR01484 family)